ncbi:MAG TPA: DUF58 domain-containing protein [Actinomycetota bacterium]|nr:DUF58 domain-containing protein [Actinomycetota bacterium]
MAEPLLDPGLLARLEALQLRSRHRLAGLFSGEHRSSRHGSSPDFSDYRTYFPGDDFRRVDYTLYARLDVLLVKLFEAEDELHLRLLVDTSGSMGAHGKLAAAKRLAAALGFVALVNRDPVSVHTFPLDRPAPRFLGRSASGPLFAHLESLTASGTTPFAAAASRLLSRPGPRGVTVLLSDLLTDEWEAGLKRLPSRGGDLVVVHVLAPEELDPPMVGDLDLLDREDGTRVEVSLSPETLKQFRADAAAWADGVATRCRRAGAAYLRLDPAADLEPLLLGAWREAGVLR